MKQKRDAAVERLVRKWKLRLYSNNSGPDERVMRTFELRAIITEARQSAARECAEIARTKPCMSFCDVAIRERFDLEAADGRA